jgi:hypothetical protein
MRKHTCTLAERNHTSLDTDRLELGAVELIRRPRQLLIVDIFLHAHLTGVNLKDTCAGFLVGKWELNLTVQTPGTKQCRVENIDTVGRCNNLCNSWSR